MDTQVSASDRRGIPRRQFLQLVGASAVGAAAVAPLGDRSAGAGPPLPPGYTPSFPQGVMSGDPAPDGAVIMTKVAPPAGGEDLPVLWEISDRADFATITTGGTTTATAATRHSVKVPLTGLTADRWWFYRFTVGGTGGPTGRLRTAPDPSSSPDSITVAWASCQQRGTDFMAHKALAAEPDVDFFLHLGDYIYTGQSTYGGFRDDYDAWQTIPNLQDLHAALPVVPMFDDGEVRNEVDGTLDPAVWAAAKQAWFESFPVIPPASDPGRAHRSFRWGDLLEVFMIDVRSYRDPAVDENTNVAPGDPIFDPNRTTLGADQQAWLKAGLAGTPACWKVLGNPYNMGVWRVLDLDPGPPRPAGVHPQAGEYAPNEAWDDFWAERRELLAFLRDEGIDGTVSLSGHTHIWIASELSADIDDPAEPIVAHDFTCGSLTPDPDVITSPPDQYPGDRSNPAEVYDWFDSFLQPLSVKANPGQTYLNFINQGYGLATFTPEETRVTFRAVNPYSTGVETATIAEFTVPKGDPCLTTTSYSIPCYSCGERYPGGQSEPVTTTCAPRDGGTGEPVPGAGPVAASPTFTG